MLSIARVISSTAFVSPEPIAAASFGPSAFNAASIAAVG
jgi:hypothetical protein